MVMFEDYDELAERNHRLVSWLVVPLLVIFMIAALIAPVFIEPSETPPVEAIFEHEATPTLTTTPTTPPGGVATPIPGGEHAGILVMPSRPFE